MVQLMKISHSLVPPDVLACCSVREGCVVSPAFRVGIPDEHTPAGNTKELWPVFCKEIRQYGCLPSHPIDVWTMSATSEVATAAASTASTPGSTVEVRYGFETGQGRLVAMQRLAHSTGLAHHNTDVYLSLHPDVGPWFALRSVIILKEVEWRKPQPDPPSSPIPAATEKVLRASLLSALDASVEPPAVPLSPGVALPQSAPWAAWAKMRQQCSLRGSAQQGWTWDTAWVEAEYPEDMLAYHYGKDTRVLPHGGSDPS